MFLALSTERVDDDAALTSDTPFLGSGIVPKNPFRLHCLSVYLLLRRDKGHVCIFAPKCHPELQLAIEMTWAFAKRYCRKHCNHRIDRLRASLQHVFQNLAQDVITLDLVRKLFRKTRNYVSVYEADAARQGCSVEATVKKYKSHRRLFESTVSVGPVERADDLLRMAESGNV